LFVTLPQAEAVYISLRTRFRRPGASWSRAPKEYH